jgi:hypothetical protein
MRIFMVAASRFVIRSIEGEYPPGVQKHHRKKTPTISDDTGNPKGFQSVFRLIPARIGRRRPIGFSIGSPIV